MSKRRSIRNKMKSLKINYLQGGNSCGLCFFANCTKKGVKPESFAPLIEEILFNVSSMKYNSLKIW